MRFFLDDATSALSSSDVVAMATAISLQVAEDVAPAWGIEAPLVVCGAEPGVDGAPDDWVIHLVDDEAQGGDLGWHAEAGTLPFGVVYVRPILAAGGGPLLGRGPDAPSVASVVSHEVLETLIDLDADDWAPGPGADYALEVCDPVEGVVYQCGGCELSDFVLPAWFQVGAPGPWSFRGAAPGPFELAPGGYAITRGPDGSITSLFGDRQPPAWRLGGPRAQRRRHAREAR